MHVVIGVFPEQLDVRVERILHTGLDLMRWPGAVPAVRISKRDREFVAIGQRPGDRLPRGQRHRDGSAARLRRIKHVLKKLEPLQPLADAREVAGWRMARGAAAAAVEVPAARLGVSGLQVRHLDGTAPAFGSLVVNEGDHRREVCLVEAKRWDRVLDREEALSEGETGVPSTQMLRYLRRVDDVTRGGLRWGMLTNGRHWRLYFRGALSVAEDFLEIDLGRVFDLPGCETDLLDRRPDSFASDADRLAYAFVAP